jgi:pilus assembly protein Flp/PilA
LELTNPECPRENPKEDKYMKNMKQLFAALIAEESGQDLIEYALVAALVGLGAVAAMQGLKNSVSNTFSNVSNQLNTATS